MESCHWFSTRSNHSAKVNSPPGQFRKVPAAVRAQSSTLYFTDSGIAANHFSPRSRFLVTQNKWIHFVNHPYDGNRCVSVCRHHSGNGDSWAGLQGPTRPLIREEAGPPLGLGLLWSIQFLDWAILDSFFREIHSNPKINIRLSNGLERRPLKGRHNRCRWYPHSLNPCIWSQELNTSWHIFVNSPHPGPETQELNRLGEDSFSGHRALVLYTKFSLVICQSTAWSNENSLLIIN